MELIAKTIDGDEDYLRQTSVDVDLNDKRYIEEIEKLEEYCVANDLFALAAIQLGIPKRLVYFRNTRLDKIEDEEWNERRIMINPVILKRYGLTKYWEACASCLDNMGLVSRPYKIHVEYIDEFGKKKKEIFRGFEATVLSHEYDHLNGVLHMDIAEEIIVMPREERKAYREEHGYEIFAKKGNYEELMNKK